MNYHSEWWVAQGNKDLQYTGAGMDTDLVALA